MCLQLMMLLSGTDLQPICEEVRLRTKAKVVMEDSIQSETMETVRVEPNVVPLFWWIRRPGRKV